MPYVGPDPRVESLYRVVFELHKNAIKKVLHELFEEDNFQKFIDIQLIYKKDEKIKELEREVLELSTENEVLKEFLKSITVDVGDAHMDLYRMLVTKQKKGDNI